jgi:hypothetical protein
MLAVSGGRLVSLSTPHGKRGWFFEAWESTDAWERIKITAHDCPRITRAHLQEEQRQLPAAAYASEYMCEFTDAIDAVFAYDDVTRAVTSDVTRLYEEDW